MVMEKEGMASPGSSPEKQHALNNVRKSKKPLMEKKRRARINECLNQLKSLVLQAVREEKSQCSKLEKADILELTVQHMRSLQKLQAGQLPEDHPMALKFRDGFTRCAQEVSHYIQSMPVHGDVSARLMNHLHGCLSTVDRGDPGEELRLQQHASHLPLNLAPSRPVVLLHPPSASSSSSLLNLSLHPAAAAAHISGLNMSSLMPGLPYVLPPQPVYPVSLSAATTAASALPKPDTFQTVYTGPACEDEAVTLCGAASSSRSLPSSTSSSSSSSSSAFASASHPGPATTPDHTESSYGSMFMSPGSSLISSTGAGPEDDSGMESSSSPSSSGSPYAGQAKRIRLDQDAVSSSSEVVASSVWRPW